MQEGTNNPSYLTSQETIFPNRTSIPILRGSTSIGLMQQQCQIDKSRNNISESHLDTNTTRKYAYWTNATAMPNRKEKPSRKWI